MATNFIIQKTTADSDGTEVAIDITYEAVLDGTVAEIFMVVDSNNKRSVCLQPWKTNNDGSRSDWTSEDEVVEWFKARD